VACAPHVRATIRLTHLRSLFNPRAVSTTTTSAAWRKPTMAPVWLITGCSSGFGCEIAKAALARQATVVATARGNVKERLAELTAAGCDAVSLDVRALPSIGYGG
jgi:hypothetical protein